MIPIVGMAPNSTVDYPGKLTATMFVKGCPFTCIYCHNALISYQAPDNMPIHDPAVIQAFLANRKGFLDGIVISGGEPCMYPELGEFCLQAKSFGYKVGLHTNGYYPDHLKTLLHKGYIDYVAMDVKAPPKAYKRVTGVVDSCPKVALSIINILSSGINYMFRTTYHPEIISEEELLTLMEALCVAGVKNYTYQSFRPLPGVIDTDLKNHASFPIPEKALLYGETHFPQFHIS